ncbi:hypothetical protein SOV_44330 [Sporomusa ovata DSM 2662]|uniref:Lipoyl-binding domain-containing protein n=1 Tax=Sporomusa ovata TaxID=2378 RepID=A0A0U1KU12_9FIRM|nr:lipoyl domain-containing protein [Sporomusa ovata]EQB26821.1 hypothetical protein SOV_3c06950 [Sporomusa ovata DSM 2662]CQR70921.1 hypothetical protein SpAn4DRAFT_1899 [Sporomusa ovata]
MKEAILVPSCAMPKRSLEKTCSCQDKPTGLRYKTGKLLWLKDIGEFVSKDEAVCEGEIEKKVFDFCAPCDGYLVEKCIEDQEEFLYGDILGYVNNET